MTNQQTILIIEDEDDLRDIIVYNLKNEGYLTLEADSGEIGLSLVSSKQPDLLLLDLMMPGLNGLEICKQLKANPATKNIPVIMVSAKGEEADIVIGLELGAEDYVPKPFSPRVLLARIRAVLRRSTQSQEEEHATLRVDTLEINEQKHMVSIDDVVVSLTKSEFNILYFLMNNKDWVYTRAQIVNAIHGERYVVTDRAIDVQITALRKKIGDYGALIETVRGIGYRFKA